MSIDTLSSTDRLHAEQIVSDFLKSLTEQGGFEIIERGAQWYSYRLRRPWDPDIPSLLQLAREWELEQQRAAEEEARLYQPTGQQMRMTPGGPRPVKDM